MIVRAWLGVGMVGSTLLLTGCAQINKVFDNDKGGTYQRSGSVQSLDLPPDLTAPKYDSTFTINNAGSAISARTAGTGVGARANVLPESVGMAFKGQGDNRYLEVDLPAGQLWENLQAFWASRDIKLRRNEAQIGVMETAWIEKKGDLPRGTIQKLLGSFLKNVNDMGIRDRYKVRLERAGSKTKVYMTHRGAEQVVTDVGSSWEGRPADPEKAAEMLNRLQAYLQKNARKSKPIPQAKVVNNVQQPRRNVQAKPTVTRATVAPPPAKPSTRAAITTPLTVKPTLNNSVALSTTGTLGADVLNLPKRKSAPPPPVTKRPPIVKAAASDSRVAEKAAKKETASKSAAPPARANAKLAFLSTTNDGQPALGVRQSAKKTFATIDAVLKKAGFAIDGKNAKNGLYAIRYTGNKSLVKKGSKQILHIIKIGKVSAMRLLDINGKPLSANKAKKILRGIESGFNRS